MLSLTQKAEPARIRFPVCEEGTAILESGEWRCRRRCRCTAAAVPIDLTAAAKNRSGAISIIGRAYGIAESIDDRLDGGGVDTGRRVGDELLREDCVGTMEEKGSSHDDEEEIRHRFTCVGLHTILLSRLEPITLLRKTPPEFAGSTGFQTESVTKNKF